VSSSRGRTRSFLCRSYFPSAHNLRDASYPLTTAGQLDRIVLRKSKLGKATQYRAKAKILKRASDSWPLAATLADRAACLSFSSSFCSLVHRLGSSFVIICCCFVLLVRNSQWRADGPTDLLRSRLAATFRLNHYLIVPFGLFQPPSRAPSLLPSCDPSSPLQVPSPTATPRAHLQGIP
jgi:hypothetical protein